MNLFFDLETIPSSDPKVHRAIADEISPPGNISKADTLANWHAEKKPALVREAIAKTALDGAYGSICCIGWAVDDGEVLTAVGGGEENVIRQFLTSVDSFRSTRHGLTPVICGHNIINFDIRFLWQRAIILGIRMPNWFPRDPRPFDRDVADTMLMFAGYRGHIGLTRLCDALGIDVDDEIDGSQIGELWANGEYEKVASHCRADVAKVREVHKRMMAAFGEM